MDKKILLALAIAAAFGSPAKAVSTIYLSTDKAVYAPGDTVRLTASTLPSGSTPTIRYRHGADIVYTAPMTSTEWQWTAPADDYRGYLVEISRSGDNGENTESGSEEILGTIAVDVSTDWTRFPRYGFVATFDESKLLPGVIDSEMEYLNRCHINGVQFQDWHMKHHWPLGGTRLKLLDRYTDIANREVVTEVVKRYIAAQHAYGMKSIFYNLAFGALKDAKSDGVDKHWYLFRDRDHRDKDYHGLPYWWKSNIYLVDPGNPAWQKYIGDRNDDVYACLDFDGYQIDQLGNRGQLYDYEGNRADLPAGYESFVRAMKERHPDKRLIMNSVGSFGADRILGTGLTDFAYNEPWGDEARFSDLHKIIHTNDSLSPEGIRTVFAAYMNYDKAGRFDTSNSFDKTSRDTAYMNLPGVLLTDAVIMALGGDHLELGDHMLSREYFPTAPLAMSDELRSAMIAYYDFMTAYQNLLRDGSTADEYTPTVFSPGTGVLMAAWPPVKNSVTVYARRHGDSRVMHLLNFSDTDDLSWRDLDGTRPAPPTLESLPLTIKVDKKPTRIWTATPDTDGGTPRILPFTYLPEGYITLTIPSLIYWTMLVIE